jgi:hypothetical protein
MHNEVNDEQQWFYFIDCFFVHHRRVDRGGMVFRRESHSRGEISTPRDYFRSDFLTFLIPGRDL